MNKIQYIQNLEMFYIFIVMAVFLIFYGKLEKRLEDNNPTVKINGCKRGLIGISLWIGFMIIQLIFLAFAMPNKYGDIYFPFTFMVSYILSALILYNYDKKIYK